MKLVPKEGVDCSYIVDYDDLSLHTVIMRRNNMRVPKFDEKGRDIKKVFQAAGITCKEQDDQLVYALPEGHHEEVQNQVLVIKDFREHIVATVFLPH